MSILVRPMQTIKWFEPNQVNTEIHAAEISDLAGILSAGRQEIDFPSEKKIFLLNMILQLSTALLHSAEDMIQWYTMIHTISTSVFVDYSQMSFLETDIFLGVTFS